MSKGVWYSAGMLITSPAIQYLEQKAIAFRIFTHTHLPASLKEAACERDQKTEQVIRSILFRIKPGQFVMVLMAGPGQISWKQVRAHLGVSRLSMATKGEVKEITGYEIGTVNPFGLPPSIRLLVDKSVFKPKEISIGCGVLGSALILKTGDLQRVLASSEIGLFSESSN
jgi:Cys-tRNA(Pro)/Cys-tRNA(Cys) deacylase